MRDLSPAARRSTSLRAALLRSALLCCTLCGLVAGCGGNSGGGGDGGAALRSVPAGVAEWAALAPILGASLTADGLTLELYALPGGTAAPSQRTALDELAAGDLVARHRLTTAGVSVWLERHDTSDPRAAADAEAVGASVAVCRIAHDLHVVRLTLPQPLGESALVDAATGLTLEPMVQAHILRPQSLPDGWRLLDEHPLREGDRQTGWAQRWGEADVGATLSIVQRRIELGPTRRLDVGRAEVASVVLRGVPATWSRHVDGNAASLVWNEGDWEVALSSASPDGIRPALDRSTLVAAAEQLVAAETLDAPLR